MVVFNPAFASGAFWTLTTCFYSNSANMWFLKEMKSGIAHNLTRFAGCFVLCLLFSLVDELLGRTNKGKGANTKIRFDKFKLLIFPALCMVVMNISNSLALASVGVTLTYVIKATIPVWTCLYCYVFEKQRYSLKIVAALCLSCVGVALACFGELTFNWRGLFFGVLSCLSQCAFNLSSKIQMKKAGLSDTPMQGFASCVTVAAVFALFFYVSGIEEVLNLKTFPVYTQTYSELTASPIQWDSFLLLFYVFTSYFLEYASNFIFVTYVTPVAFSITDIVRRVGTIITNAVMFNAVLNTMNIAGVFLSLSGAALYSVFTAQEQKAKGAKKRSGSTPTKKPKSPASSAKKRGSSRSKTPVKRRK